MLYGHQSFTPANASFFFFQNIKKNPFQHFCIHLHLARLLFHISKVPKRKGQMHLAFVDINLTPERQVKPLYFSSHFSPHLCFNENYFTCSGKTFLVSPFHDCCCPFHLQQISDSETTAQHHVLSLPPCPHEPERNRTSAFWLCTPIRK